VCGFVTAGGRAGGRCPNLTTASARSVCVSLSAFFIVIIECIVLEDSDESDDDSNWSDDFGDIKN